MSAAFSINSSGIASNTAPPTSTVRHSDSPQTEQHWLLPTSALSHSSRGLPEIQILFDEAGSPRNDSSCISFVSRVGSIPSGARTSVSIATARCKASNVTPQRSQVCPSGFTSLCQTIGIVLRTGSLSQLSALVTIRPSQSFYPIRAFRYLSKHLSGSSRTNMDYWVYRNQLCRRESHTVRGKEKKCAYDKDATS